MIGINFTLICAADTHFKYGSFGSVSGQSDTLNSLFLALNSKYFENTSVQYFTFLYFVIKKSFSTGAPSDVFFYQIIIHFSCVLLLCFLFVRMSSIKYIYLMNSMFIPVCAINSCRSLIPNPNSPLSQRLTAPSLCQS